MLQPSHERHHERRNVTKDDDDIVRQIPAATVCTTGISVVSAWDHVLMTLMELRHL